MAAPGEEGDLSGVTVQVLEPARTCILMWQRPPHEYYSSAKST